MFSFECLCLSSLLLDLKRKKNQGKTDMLIALLHETCTYFSLLGLGSVRVSLKLSLCQHERQLTMSGICLGA